VALNEDVFAALEAQTDRLDAILTALDDEAWAAPSLCPGWSVADVVLHLGQTEEAVAATIEGGGIGIPVEGAATIDEAMDNWVRAESGASSHDVHARWDAARKRAAAALRAADPGQAVGWAATPLRPKTLATTRLSEHWIHTMDIAEPLDIDNPDTDDIKHLAWLAVKTIPYAFAKAGREDPPTVRAELTAPSGDLWELGPPDAECSIAGPASEFVRIAARRLPADGATGVSASGRNAGDVLELVRTYA
jgi:uncharacterized protein (TIGR03084 family)